MHKIRPGVVDLFQLERQLEDIADALLEAPQGMRPGRGHRGVRGRRILQGRGITHQFEEHRIVGAEALIDVLVIGLIGKMDDTEEIHDTPIRQGEGGNADFEPVALVVFGHPDIIRTRRHGRRGCGGSGFGCLCWFGCRICLGRPGTEQQETRSKAEVVRKFLHGGGERPPWRRLLK